MFADLNLPFNLRELRYFVAAAELGQLTAAAGALHVAQPALSQVVAQLESRLGTELLERNPSGVALTEAGRAFYEKARAALRAADEAVSAVGPWVRGETRVLLGFPPSSQALARPLQRRFMECHPQIAIDAVHVHGGERLAALRAGAIDVELAYPPPREHDLVTARVLASPRYAVLGERHRLAGREALRFREVSAELAGGDSGACAPPGGAETPVGLDRLWAHVYAGKAIAVLPRFMLSAAVGDGVRAIPLVDVEPLEVALVRRREDERSAVAALLDLAQPRPALAPVATERRGAAA